MCKTERLQPISTPLGPYDKNYSRKRLREHSLDRTDGELFLSNNGSMEWKVKLQLRRKTVCLLSFSLPETFPGLEQPLSNSGQHVLVHSQPPHAPAVHVFRELHAAWPEQPRHHEHTSKEAQDSILLCAVHHEQGSMLNLVVVRFTDCLVLKDQTTNGRTAAITAASVNTLNK